MSPVVRRMLGTTLLFLLGTALGLGPGLRSAHRFPRTMRMRPTGRPWSTGASRTTA